MQLRASALAALFLFVGAAPAAAETQEAKVEKTPAKIQWFGTWEQGKAEAKRTGRPILLTAAAPQCRGISGMW